MSCAAIDSYVGLEDCNTFDKQPLGIVLTHKDYSTDFISADITRQALTQAAKDVSKVLPFLEGLINVEPSGGNTRVSQEGFGNPSVNGYEPFQEVYTFIKGGLCLYKSIAHLHGADMRVFFVDEALNLYGTVVKGNTIKYMGFDVNVGIEYRKNVGTQVGAVKITLLYTYAYPQQLKAIQSLSLNTPLRGLRSVAVKATLMSASTFRFKLMLACSGSNISRLLNGHLSPYDISVRYNGANDPTVNPTDLTFVTGNDTSQDYFETTVEQQGLLGMTIALGNISNILDQLFLGMKSEYVKFDTQWE